MAAIPTTPGPVTQGRALTFQAVLHVTLVVLQQGVVPLGMIFHHVELLAGFSHPGSKPTWGMKMGGEGWDAVLRLSAWGRGRGQGERGATSPVHSRQISTSPLSSPTTRCPTSSAGRIAKVLFTCMCTFSSPASYQFMSKIIRWAGSGGLTCYYAHCSFHFIKK